MLAICGARAGIGDASTATVVLFRCSDAVPDARATGLPLLILVIHAVLRGTAGARHELSRRSSGIPQTERRERRRTWSTSFPSSRLRFFVLRDELRTSANSKSHSR